MIKDAERIKYYLLLWTNWQRSNKSEINTMLGYPSQCLLLVGGGSSSFEDMADDAESRAASIVDSIINDMPTNERIAIHHFNLAAVWRSNRINLEDCYANALELLEAGLNKKGLA